MRDWLLPSTDRGCCARCSRRRSVGQPRDYDPRASYTLFDTEKKRFEFKRVDYDIKASAEKIFGTDLEPNFGHRLFIGV